MMLDDNGLLTIGLPIAAPDGRPLVVFHPAAGYQYRASWSVMVDHGSPFVLIANDMYPDYPDGYPGLHDAADPDYFQRIQSWSDDAVYVHSGLDYPHRLVHQEGCAKVAVENLTACDILHIDWLDWLRQNINENEGATFDELAANFAPKVVDGGLILLDLKHNIQPNDIIHPWFQHPDGTFEVGPGVTLTLLGHANWPMPVLESYGRDIDARVFRVANEHLSSDDVVMGIWP
jgi:hypothetical protein